MKYKYTLIVSQYYHSRHSFVVEFAGDKFMEQAKKFVTELEKYKRKPTTEREIDFGDLTYKQIGEIWSRYNINDQGDIYIINAHSVNRCMHEANEYHEISARESRGYKRKLVTVAIEEHHDYGMVKNIVEKYFEIA